MLAIVTATMYSDSNVVLTCIDKTFAIIPLISNLCVYSTFNRRRWVCHCRRIPTGLLLSCQMSLTFGWSDCRAVKPDVYGETGTMGWVYSVHPPTTRGRCALLAALSTRAFKTRFRFLLFRCCVQKQHGSIYFPSLGHNYLTYRRYLHFSFQRSK
jgi:hypothetical protein